MTDIWADSDVSILFSEYEGMSISMAESMGQGCVPVVTDVSGAREAIIHGETGFIFQVGDVKAAASFLSTLKNNKTILEKISHACVSHTRSRGDFHRYDSDFMSVIQQVTTTKQAARWPVEKKIIPDRDQTSRSIYERVYARAGRLMRTLKNYCS